ncbi:MAG: hydroxymethylglutaryl-CoA reductase [Clostridiales bacterium]|nr:hydroxymethylglutaryl-CoA reductase [Clostridiales bacterium]MDN5282484.1 hydroxymethylglutaryl-CoA reductase [Candidatus Ozemobacter sp.]
MFQDTLKIIPRQQFASKEAIISDDGHGKVEKLTFQQFWQNVEQVSDSLREAGIKKGDRVIILSENHLRWLPVFLGIAGSGAIAVPVDGNLAIERFHAIVEDCKPSAIFISRKFEERFAEFMLTDCKVSATLNLNFDLILFETEEEPENEPEHDEPLKPHDIAAIIYTSGTTGSPKGIMLSHRAFVESIKLGTEISDYKSEDKILALLPFTHVFALVDSGLVQLHNHSTIVVCNSFNPAEIMQVLMKYQLTYILAVPRLAELFAMGLMQAPDLKIPGLTMIIGGAAPRPEIMKLMISRGIRVFQGFGMTETAAGVLIGSEGPIESVGKPDKHVKVKIDNPVNGVGELLISTPTIFSGVYLRPDLDAELFTGEFFRTGDLAEIDKEGYVYIRGRAKEVIISSSGLNVYPDELEMRLGTLPYAEEFVVFGFHENGLEVPALAMLRRNEFFKDNSVGKVQEFVEEDIRNRTANWPEAEKIRRIFLSEKPLPRSASAKIKRFEVASIFNPEYATPEKVSDRNTALDGESDSRLFELFRQEVATFLNAEHSEIDRKTRLDSFLQLDSLGVVALLISLEKKFEVSFRELIGTSLETFEELYHFFASQADLEHVLSRIANGVATNTDCLPAMLDLSKEAIEKRQEFIRNETDNNDFQLPVPEKSEKYSGNIEGLIGMTHLPTGICGPLKVKGQEAVGDFYVPLATSEGALVASVARGCQVITMAGGAEVQIVSDSIVRTPIFIFNSLDELAKFSRWVESNFEGLREAAESTTSHGKLLNIEHFPIGTKLVLRFIYSTGDASGQNMTTIATRRAVDHILAEYDGHIEDWFLESNLSGDKKINGINFTGNRGKKVLAVCRIPADIIRKNLHTTPERMCRLAELSMITSLQAHSFGVQAHYANTLAAVYIAAGQDPACVAESAAGITHLELINGDLQISVTLPGIMVGTVGGGTRLPTQNRCLQMMTCSGPGKARKFAEILAAAVLAGEISIIGAMAADEFTDAHAKYGRSGGMKAGKK